MWRIVKKVFLHELKKLPKDVRAKVEEFVFTALPATADPLTLPNMQRLIGHREFYRVRFGDYRLGLRIDPQARVVECCRVKHLLTDGSLRLHAVCVTQVRP